MPFVLLSELVVGWVCVSACSVVGAVHVGAVQGAVTHALHRLRPLPAAVRVRRLADHRQYADHGQYADRSHVLRPVRRPVHVTHTDLRHVQAHVR